MLTYIFLRKTCAHHDKTINFQLLFAGRNVNDTNELFELNSWRCTCREIADALKIGIKLSMHQILSAELSLLRHEYQIDVVQLRNGQRRMSARIRREFQVSHFPFHLRISSKFHACSSYRIVAPYCASKFSGLVSYRVSIDFSIVSSIAIIH